MRMSWGFRGYGAKIEVSRQGKPAVPQRAAADALARGSSQTSAVLTEAMRMMQGASVSQTYDLVILGAGSGGYAAALRGAQLGMRSEEHTSELQSRGHLVCRLLLAKKD